MGPACTLRRKQIPLSYAGATTIHDVQGMTVDTLYASLDRIYSRSLLYVIISRVRNLSSLVILRPEIHHEDSGRHFYQSKGTPSVYVITDCRTHTLFYVGFSRDIENRVKAHCTGRFH